MLDCWGATSIQGSEGFFLNVEYYMAAINPITIKDNS